MEGLLLTNPVTFPARKTSPNLQLHHPLPNPLNCFIKTKISSVASSLIEIQTNTNQQTNPFKSPSRKRRFLKKDAFPLSLPLHTKNPHIIYEDIKRFARQGKLKEALTILDYLDQQGIPVNATTFSSLIAACVRSKSLVEGRQVHAFIRINEMEDNDFLRTKLVHMYTSCGSIEDAKRVFHDLPHGSVYPWNALLRGNVVRGGRQYREVLTVYTKMRELGVELNVYTFSCLLKSFAGSTALTQGMKTHALLIKNGFASGSIILQTSLIDMYFKCGKIKLARQVFEEIPEKDVVMWGAMIAGFAHNRLQRDAVTYSREMIRQGIEPNSAILTMILPVIGELWARKLGREVHGYVIKTKDYAKHLFIRSALIDMYCKCGDMDSGRQVFYSSMERNAVSWTALMSGYVSNGRLEQALRSIVWMQQEGVKPDVVTIATVLPVCAKLKALKQGKEIHGYLVKNCFLPNVSLITSLIGLYSKCGGLENCRKLFDGMEKRNVISWTAMIDAYLSNHCLHEALEVFRSMQLSKHRPDSVAVARILSACGELGNLKLGKELHGYVLKRDFELIPFISAEIVKMYGKCRVIEKAKLVFNAMPSKGSMMWTAIIEVYGCNNIYRGALNLFNQMTSDGFSPNKYTFDVVLSICGQAGFADEACKIFNCMTRRYNIKPSEEHFSIIIELLRRTGWSEEAQRFIRMKSPGA
ncbi:pentatricopeptide repeat-containing protein At1g71460, chloroplastic [Macadamia integrifolia]|uniref:pentatricopeptide repeat-containing protein At1g71460, chloroplastic n=1 Tax=Macadamia integrifolia TaxID=60698 RepID=UPI001C4EB891|nr:pentatricopeptide repeat-containing protein At1g71460, chloroplastic [Macadamia integrifolia]